MSDFPINIKLNPEGADAKLKNVESALAATEAKAKQTAQALGAASNAFKSLGQAIKQEIEQQRSAMIRSTEVHNQLTSVANKAAQGFAKMAEAIQREKDMLESMRGPGRQAIEDIQTLNSMLAKGAISAAEFNQKLSQIRPPSNFARGGGGASGGFDVSGALGGLPGGNIVAGALGGGVAGAASAGLQTAVGAAGEVISMADAYTSLNNRLVALTGSQAKATELFDKLHASADKTRSDINTTASSFVQFSRATRDLGVNQSQVLAFTEHLNEAIALSGADSAAAQAGLLQLSQAMASGALRGQDLHSVMEQIPIVAQTIQDHLHVTAGKFKEMADNGEITAKVVFDAFNDAGPKLERQFGQSVPTIGQQFQVLKNDISATVGELAQQVNITKVAADTIANLKIAIDVAAASMKPLNDGLNAVGLSMGDLVSAGGTGLRAISDFFNDSISGKGSSFYEKMTNGQQNFADQQEVINRVVAEGTGHLNEYEQSMVQSTLQTQLGSETATAFHEAILRATGVTDEWRDATAGVSAKIAGLVGNISNVVNGIAQWDGALDALLRKMDPWYDAHQRVISGAEAINADFLQLLRTGENVWDKLTDKLNKNATAAKHAADEYAKYVKAAVEAEAKIRNRAVTPQDHSVASFDMLRPKPGGPIDHSFEDADAEAKRMASAQADAIIAENGRIVAAQEELAKAAKENADKARDAWTQGLGSITAELINMAEKGKFSFDELASAAAKLALQMAAMQMGGSGGSFLSALAGGLGGFATGGSFTVPGGSGAYLPRAWSGNDWTIGGSGGTDSKLVAFMGTPGETVHVRTPAQQAEVASRSGGETHVTNVIHVQDDSREIVAAGMRSGRVQRELVKLDRRGLFRRS